MFSVALRANAEPLMAALAELNALWPNDGSLELDGRCLSGQLRELLVRPVLDASKLVRIDSHPAADGTPDVLVSFQPSELCLELLAALRARNFDVLLIETDIHGRLSLT